MQLPHLPITTALPAIKKALVDGSAVISAPPGSGKTTIIPLALLREPWLENRKILILQPRRIAARATCHRMAELMEEEVGRSVGYHIRHDRKVCEQTKIEVVTEGILTRRLQNNPDLDDIGLIIFDEYHERSIHADLALALVLDLLEVSDHLRVLIMSATLDGEPVAQLLGGVPIIKAEGVVHPVIVEYLDKFTDTPLASLTAEGVKRVLERVSGDILVFLPGISAIRETARILEDELDSDILIQPLYGNLPQKEQNKILFPERNSKKRVVLSTPLAETSLTIEGISAVVDSGWCRKPVYNPTNGLTTLKTMRISKSSADQRAGRAGRLGPGFCLRLWDKSIHHSLPDFHPPEIINADLTSLVLEVLLWGVRSPDELKWLDPPRKSNYQKAVSQLQLLGALSGEGKLLQLGKDLGAVPLHPRLGLLLVKSCAYGLLETGAIISALLSERDPLRGDVMHSAEISLRLELLESYDKTKKHDISKHGGQVDICRRIKKSANTFKKNIPRTIKKWKNSVSVSILLAHAYPDRIAKRVSTDHGSYLLANGRRAHLQPGDPLIHSEYLVIAALDGGKKEGRIHLAEPLDLRELQKQLPQLFMSTQSVEWDAAEGRITAIKQEKLGALTIQEKPLHDVNEELITSALLRAIRESDLGLLSWTNKATQLQGRVALLRDVDSSFPWPDLGLNTLKNDINWLAAYLNNIRNRQQLSKLNIYEILLSTLDYTLQKRLKSQTPETYRVPTGSNIKLDYSNPEQPILSVRLQEVLGLQHHPTLCEGKVPLLLHLLSPAGRPIQITSDIVGFWETSYQEVKKDLKGRYPKHYWPDNPLEAIATKTTKRNMKQIR